MAVPQVTSQWRPNQHCDWLAAAQARLVPVSGDRPPRRARASAPVAPLTQPTAPMMRPRCRATHVPQKRSSVSPMQV
eukprot:s1363_g5.t1